MSRRRRILLVAVATVAVLLVAVVAVAPLVARQRLTAALHAAGYPDARVGGVGLGLWGATVRDLALDERGTLEIAEVAVRWRLGGLLHGRLVSVAVHGATLALVVGPTGPDLTPLLPQAKHEPEPTPTQTAPAAAATPSAWPTDLPLERATIDGARVVLGRGSLREPLAVELTAVHLGGGAVHLQGTVAGVGGTIALAGTAGPAGLDVHADLQGLASERLVALALPADRPAPPPLVLGGTVRWSQAAGTAGTLVATVTVAGLGGTLTADGAWALASGASGSVAIGDVDLAAALAAAGPWLPPLPVRGVTGRVGGLLHLDHGADGYAAEGTLEVRGLTATHDLGKARARLLTWTGRATQAGLTVLPAGTLLPATVGALRVEDAQVVLSGVLRGGALTVAVPQAVVGDDGERLAFHGRLLAAGATADVAGETDRGMQRIDARVLATDLDLAAWSAWLPVALPVQVAGKAALNLRVIRLGESLGGTATLNGENMAITDPGGQWRFTAASAGVDGGFNLSDDGVIAHAATRIAGGALEASAVGVAVTGLDGTFPWSLNDDPGLTGDLTGMLAVRGLSEPVRLRARLVDHRLYGRVDARLLGLVGATAEGYVEFVPAGLSAHLAVAVPRSVISDPDALAKAMPELAGWQVAGTVGASGTVDLLNGVPVPDLRLTVEDALLARPADGWRVEGAATAVTVSGLSPWRATTDQPFSAARCAWHDQVVTAVSGRLGVEGQLLTVHDLTLGWGGGRIGSPLLSVDLAAHQVAGELTAEHVGLDAVLAACAPGQVTGSGALAGHMPVSLRWDDLRIGLGVGVLHADPPDGWVRISDRARVAALIGPGGAVDANLRERLVDTVRDFRFKSLSLTTTREADGDLLTKVEVAGIGREGPDPLELGGLTFNIRGVEAALNQALRLKGHPAPPPPQDDTLDRFFGP